jgi:hypothetical protein
MWEYDFAVTPEYLMWRDRLDRDEDRWRRRFATAWVLIVFVGSIFAFVAFFVGCSSERPAVRAEAEATQEFSEADYSSVALRALIDDGVPLWSRENFRHTDAEYAAAEATIADYYQWATSMSDDQRAKLAYLKWLDYARRGLDEARQARELDAERGTLRIPRRHADNK